VPTSQTKVLIGTTLTAHKISLKYFRYTIPGMEFIKSMVLPVFSNVLERVVHDQLISHLQKFNLLSDRQSGFRPHHSTQDVLVHVTDQVTDSVTVGVKPLMSVNQGVRNKQQIL